MKGSIHLRGAAANAFLGTMYSDDQLESAFARSCGPARQVVIAEIVRRGVKVAGVCVKCGCTDEDCSRCMARTGSACAWADDSRTLCTACVPDKYRFRWRADGKDEEAIVEATSYPQACYRLAGLHVEKYGREFPKDFEVRLGVPEIVQ